VDEHDDAGLVFIHRFPEEYGAPTAHAADRDSNHQLHNERQIDRKLRGEGFENPGHIHRHLSGPRRSGRDRRGVVCGSIARSVSGVAIWSNSGFVVDFRNLLFIWL
jgi:hypothetical protein